MEHTKKMVLIDPRVLDTLSTAAVKNQNPPNPLTDSLYQMDQQMRDILNKTDMNITDKANAYQQTLQRYLHRLDQVKNQPIGSVVIQEPKKEETTNDLSANVTTKETEPLERVSTRIIDSMSNTFKNKARLIIQHMKDNPDLAFNERGEFIWKGNIIEKSNMIDLINDILRKRKSVASPRGWQEFASALRNTNIPRELVGNIDRWNYIQRPSETQSPIKQSSETQSSIKQSKDKNETTPRRWKKSEGRDSKRRRLIDEHNWETI